jgi:hypothetical protein
MLAIGIHILQIIETIDRTRYQAEGGEYNHRRPEILTFQQIAAEENWCKNKDVLEPLQGPKQLNI